MSQEPLSHEPWGLSLGFEYCDCCCLLKVLEGFEMFQRRLHFQRADPNDAPKPVGCRQTWINFRETVEAQIPSNTHHLLHSRKCLEISGTHFESSELFISPKTTTVCFIMLSLVFHTYSFGKCFGERERWWQTKSHGHYKALRRQSIKIRRMNDVPTFVSNWHGEEQMGWGILAWLNHAPRSSLIVTCSNLNYFQEKLRS